MIISLIRMIVAINITYGMNLLGLYPFYDPAMTQAIVVYWGLLENGLATIVACLPTLPTAARRVPGLLRVLREKLSAHT